MEDIVISGVSGRLPQSDSIQEFAQQLFAGVDLVSEDEPRWPHGFLGLPRRMGKIKNLSNFDAAFFSVPSQQADRMDVQMRKLLEVTYEAFVDAGLNPDELRGTSTGVFVGAYASDSEELWNDDLENIDGYTQTGCCRAMFSNRLSYKFDFKGPSMTINTACSSSMVALVQAVKAIRAGECDAAVVAGANLNLRPHSALCFHQLQMLSTSGRCAAFDESASGFVKSEAVVSIILQRRTDARRVYATIRGVSLNTDGYKTQGITYPSGEMQTQLIEKAYEDARLRPEDVSFVEAHGTGTKVGDFEEVKSIAAAFCKNRTKPLLVGSLKSNIGHSELVAGLCSIVKVILAMETNIIPSNLHYEKPNPNIPDLNNGRIKVVNKNTDWAGGLVSVSSFGYGGANAHVVLEGGSSSRSLPAEYVVPRLVVASGRTEAAVKSLLTLAAEHPKDADLHALLHSVYSANISKHTYRGYRLLTGTANEEIFELGKERPVWFVFPGLKPHWSGSYRKLFRIPVFSTTIDACAEALKPYNVDLLYLLKKAPESEANVFTSFLSVTAVQIALVDFLRSIDIKPSGIIGYSLGEIGCAYADGALNVEQSILAAYWRIKSVMDCNISGGAMAVVGLTWDECFKRCPSDVQIVCYNSKDNVTISGPEESVQEFVEELSSENILAKRFDTDDVAYHSKYVSKAAPLLLERLQQVITHPQRRSEKWISSSMLTTGNDRVCDAAYFVNNFLSPVRFEEAMREVPDNALLVEISPVALLQTILKRQKPDSVVVPLLRPDAPDSLNQLLCSVGRLYGAGAQPHLASLYPAIEWPVSQGTPGLASRVLWDHSIKHDVPKFEIARRSDNKVAYDLSKPDGSFIEGHNIDKRTLFPGTGYLVMVWRTMAKLQNSVIEDTPIIFDNIQFKRPIIMPASGPVEFSITILKNSGEFEISEGDGAIVTGQVRVAKSPANQKLTCSSSTQNENKSITLNTDDVYKEFRVRGYHYSGVFCGIRTCDVESLSGTLEWNNNWIAFLDTMLQFKLLSLDTKQLYVLTSLRHVAIDPKTLMNSVTADNTVPIVAHKELDAISSPGIEFHGVATRHVARQINPQQAPILENHKFYPYDNTSLSNLTTMQDALSAMMQIILENIEHSTIINIVEIGYGSSSDIILQELSPVLRCLTRHIFDVSLAFNNNTQKRSPDSLNIDNVKVISIKELRKGGFQIVLASDILLQATSEDHLKSLLSMSDSGMILLEEQAGAHTKENTSTLLEKSKLVLVSCQRIGDRELLLLRRRCPVPNDSVIVEINGDDFDWVEPLREALKAANNDQRVYAVTRSVKSGILGLATALRTEPIGHSLRIYFLPDAKESFSLNSVFYFDQIEKDLFINVLQNETWGSYRHLKITDLKHTTVKTESAFVKILSIGDLSSLRWTQNNLQVTKNDGAKLCQVHYASLNFHDIMLATGKLYEEADNLDDQDSQLGLEYSGVMTNGKRVMGIVSGRGLATSVLVTDFLWEVPTEWSLEEAATVPVAYATAYYALAVRGRMRRGEAVLVHAGSGGVGQAAIAVALHAGCTVFTTVGTPDKRAFLLQRFPALAPDNIGNSRDTSFEQLVRRRTRGRGVDLVLNSLAGEQLLASVRCLAPGGRFLEIGRFDMTENTNLGMSSFLNNTTFHGVMLKNLFGADANVSEKNAVLRCLEEGIVSGAVSPLAREVFGSQQVEQAFRYMAASKHIGKVMLRVRDEKAGPLDKMTVTAQAVVHRDKFYVIVGGLGGCGLELAQWLVARGARNLLLNSRQAASTGYQLWSIQRLRAKGVRVIVDTRDLSSEPCARSLLRELAALAPVGAIFNLAAVLKDVSFESQTPEHFEIVSRPKIKITSALDEASRELCSELDYFVVFSSASCGKGNFGQSNYAFANSAAERVIERRRKDNLPGLAIQWGLIGDVGVAYADLKIKDHVAGTGVQGIASCLDTLGGLLAQPYAVVASWAPPPKKTTASQASQDIVPVISNILGINPMEKKSKHSTFEELGMDSLVGAEIKRTLERQYNSVLEIKEIYSLSFAKLQEMLSDEPQEPSLNLGNIPTIGVQELIPKSVVVKLPSREDGSAARPVFVIHPIEGVVGPVRELAASLRAPAVGLQCAAGVPTSDLAAMARCYVQHARAVQPQPPYTLLGYSYGGAVAFEMMYQLEQAGCECRLVCVDGSPQYVKSIIAQERLSERAHGAACHARTLAYFTLLVNKAEATKVACLRGVHTWDERVDATVDLLKNKTPFPADEIKMAANRFREMTRMLDEYQLNKRVRGSVTLYTASQSHVRIADDYGLKDMCSSVVRTQLPATHQSIVTGHNARVIADRVSELASS